MASELCFNGWRWSEVCNLIVINGLNLSGHWVPNNWKYPEKNKLSNLTPSYSAINYPKYRVEHLEHTQLVQYVSWTVISHGSGRWGRWSKLNLFDSDHMRAEAVWFDNVNNKIPVHLLHMPCMCGYALLQYCRRLRGIFNIQLILQNIILSWEAFIMEMFIASIAGECELKIVASITCPQFTCKWYATNISSSDVFLYLLLLPFLIQYFSTQITYGSFPKTLTLNCSRSRPAGWQFSSKPPLKMQALILIGENSVSRRSKIRKIGRSNSFTLKVDTTEPFRIFYDVNSL